jgi:hypothetical protein
MKFLFGLMLAASGMAVVSFAHSDEGRWALHEEGTTEQTLNLSGSPMRVVVDNVDGYVHVKATDGSQVHVTAHKLIRAESDADLQQAKAEVKLDMTEQPGSVTIYYDAPWRCNSDSGGCHDQQRRFYRVTYDLEIEVPRQARPIISTVNAGDVSLDGTTGDFEVSNVNGGIRMTHISGSGDARTVNGPVSVEFSRNPAGPSRFKTINGEVDVYFQPGFSADLQFKTFNGSVFSDFDVAPRALQPVAAERREGKFVYHSDGMQGARAGQGGPLLSFDTLNGNIRLHRGSQEASKHE